MAENPHLYLKIANASVSGESTQKSDGSIECLGFSVGVHTPTDMQTGSASGRRQWNPITINKRVDKCSPLLLKALTTNQAVSGTFKFFHPPTDGSSKSENYYTVDFTTGRIDSLVMNQSGGTDVPTESVSFVFRAVTFTFIKGGVSHSDDWMAT